MSVEDNIASVLELTNTTPEYQKDKLESLIAEFRLQKYVRIWETSFQEASVVVRRLRVVWLSTLSSLCWMNRLQE